MIVLGHRGAGWQHDQLPLWQENTLESFQEAKDLNADGIETDVRLYNNQLVLHHDKIEDVSWERNLPTLIDLLEWSDDNFILNLEIKDRILRKAALLKKTKEDEVSESYKNEDGEINWCGEGRAIC